MSDFNITLNKSDVMKVKTMLVGINKGAPKVMTRAINKTLTNVQTKASTEIRKDLNLPAKKVKANFSLIKATWAKVSGAFLTRGKPIGLISFVGTKELARGGVSVKVKKSKPRIALRHAFIADAKGVANVWERQKYGSGTFKPNFPYAKLPRKYRFPIRRMTGPRVEDELSKPTVLNPVVAHADARMTYHLNHELDYELSKL